MSTAATTPTRRPASTFRESVRRAAQQTAAQQRARNQVGAAGVSHARVGTGTAKKASRGSKRAGATARATGAAKTAKGTRVTKRTAGKAQRTAARGGFKGVLAGLGRGMRVLLAVALVLAVIAVILFPVAKDYYASMRAEQRLEAELAAVEERNSQIEGQNEALNTDEGVESQARSELGWVMEDEQSAVVTNAGDVTDTSTTLPGQVDTSVIHAPSTWYYTVLDTVFGVSE